MPEFKKGQLVAVRDYEPQEWQLRMFDCMSPGGQAFCRRIPYGNEPKMWWNQILPAEEVWPEIFIGWERRAGEQAAEAVAMESALVQRLRRQIGWLCQELAHADMCPSVSAIASCDKDCPRCWEQASLKAAKEDVDDVKR